MLRCRLGTVTAGQVLRRTNLDYNDVKTLLIVCCLQHCCLQYHEEKWDLKRDASRSGGGSNWAFSRFQAWAFGQAISRIIKNPKSDKVPTTSNSIEVLMDSARALDGNELMM